MNFLSLKKGQHARVVDLNKLDSVYRHKLIAMGLLPGTEFSVSRIAPFGDPIEIRVRGITLSLRKSEANLIHIEKAQRS
jgi:ferrous iron transport protein A